MGAPERVSVCQTEIYPTPKMPKFVRLDLIIYLLLFKSHFQQETWIGSSLWKPTIPLSLIMTVSFFIFQRVSKVNSSLQHSRDTKYVVNNLLQTKTLTPDDEIRWWCVVMVLDFYSLIYFVDFFPIVSWIDLLSLFPFSDQPASLGKPFVFV